MRVRVDLQAITTTVSRSVHGQDAMQDHLENTLVRQHDTLSAQVDQRIDGIEELLRAQSAQLGANQYNQLGFVAIWRKSQYSGHTELSSRVPCPRS